MDFAYYIVRKSDMSIIDGATDMVSAINIANKQKFACLILQACIITEVGSDMPEIDTLQDNNNEYVESEIIE